MHLAVMIFTDEVKDPYADQRYACNLSCIRIDGSVSLE